MFYEFMEKSSCVAYKYSYELLMQLLAIWCVYALFLGMGSIVIGAIFLIEGRFSNIDFFIDFITTITAQVITPFALRYCVDIIDEWWFTVQ